MNIQSYPKVYNIGHPAVQDLFADPVVVEEKVDGSQFSFGMLGGELCARSKNKQIVLDAPEMFGPAVETVRGVADRLEPGFVYRCEFLGQPKHNTLEYNRIPDGHLVLFDVEIEEQRFLDVGKRHEEALRVGLEPVQLLYTGAVPDAGELRDLLDTDAQLGGTKVEGVVAKNHHRFGRDGKFLAGKHVSEQFKEVHSKEWRKSNPSGKDIVQHLVDRYRAEGRWAKAVQHLQDRGELEGSPRDIGALINEAKRDIEGECVDEIKEQLWQWARKGILRGATRGLPEWYKQRLLEQQDYA